MYQPSSIPGYPNSKVWQERLNSFNQAESKSNILDDLIEPRDN